MTLNLKVIVALLKTTHILKQTRSGYHLKDIILHAYHNSKLCVVKTMQEYLARTEGFRTKGNKLLVSTQKPHNGVSQATVSRWIKTLMRKAGIQKHYGVHSTRAAATSAAKQKGLPISTIIQTAGWANARTFEKFYHKNIIEAQDLTFQDAVLG